MRPKTLIQRSYFLEDNPFPTEAIVSWGNSDIRSNGSLFNENVLPEKYQEAVRKFIVNPIDARSKFHFLWSLGDAVEARGFGKTALLHYLARTVNRDFGNALLTANEFDPTEAAETPILAAMATFDTQRVTTLAGISLEQVRYLLQGDDGEGNTVVRLRERLVRLLQDENGLTPETDAADDPAFVRAIADKIHQTDLQVGGKTFGAADKKLAQYFAAGQFESLLDYVKQATPKAGYDLLHTIFVIARAAGVQRVFLLIDQVEDFANADVPRRRRQMEVERFRDLAVETQPFGEMASYVLTMHPSAARSIDEYWLLARLPKIDHTSRQNERVTVILRALERDEEVSKLLLAYLRAFRVGQPPDELFPFDASSVSSIRRLSGGRPGEILRRANTLINEGAAEQWPRITQQEVDAYFAEEEAETRSQLRRPRLGEIDF